MKSWLRLRKLRRLIFSSIKEQKVVFVLSTLLGACLAVILHWYQHGESPVTVDRSRPIVRNDFLYEKWLRGQGLQSVQIDPDKGRYNRSHNDEDSMNPDTEASFLYHNISVACLVFPLNASSATTVAHTWGKHCNKVFFFSHEIANDTIPIVNIPNVKSSFHLLCESLRRLHSSVNDDLQWVLVATDDTFALIENLRYYVAAKNHSEPHYLGHAMQFWGEVYNWENAGYVLSRATLEALVGKFPTDAACKAGGKYWKNGDWYLGKHLATLGIKPVDTRDYLGRGRFNGYSFRKLLFPGAVSLFERYWRDSLYLSEDGPHCCSSSAVTFHGILSHSKMYQLEYMFYHLRPFYSGGIYGNVAAKVHGPKDSFLTWEEKMKDDAMEHFLDTLMTTPKSLESIMRQGMAE